MAGLIKSVEIAKLAQRRHGGQPICFSYYRHNNSRLEIIKLAGYESVPRICGRGSDEAPH
jgi:hypothetical protein